MRDTLTLRTDVPAGAAGRTKSADVTRAVYQRAAFQGEPPLACAYRRRGTKMV
jgi:hypothetical protein